MKTVTTSPEVMKKAGSHVCNKAFLGTTKKDYVTMFIHMEIVWIIYIWKTEALLIV
jgi:hypothetical protein